MLGRAGVSSFIPLQLGEGEVFFEFNNRKSKYSKFSLAASTDMFIQVWAEQTNSGIISQNSHSKG